MVDIPTDQVAGVLAVPVRVVNPSLSVQVSNFPPQPVVPTPVVNVTVPSQQLPPLFAVGANVTCLFHDLVDGASYKLLPPQRIKIEQIAGDWICYNGGVWLNVASCIRTSWSAG